MLCPGITQALSLAEVLVFGRSEYIYNVARNKETEQSSTHSGQISKLAVDGDTRPENEAGLGNNISSTPNENSPYWQVLLGSPVVIDDVVVYNRDLSHTDCLLGVCSHRLRGFRMEILKVVDGKRVCGIHLQ